MTILFLTRLFYPHIGGVEKHVMEISKRLIADGHEVIIVTEKLDDKKGSVTEEVNGIVVYRIDAGGSDWFKKIRIWQELWKSRKVIQSADVVHCHDVFFWYLPFRFLYPRKPVYTTFHGYESYPIRKSAIVMRKISEKLSWGNICIGDFIHKWYGTTPTFISYGGVDIRSKNQGAGSKADTESAVFIGRLDEQTGAPLYAQAVKMLRKKHPKFALTFVGDGKDRKKIEKKFSVLGFQENPERFFPKYHFAFVSRYLSILEAFAAKKLVFAVYDNPVKEDYLKMAPFANWIVIVENEYELYDKIDYYLNHSEEEKKLIESEYQWVSKQTWGAIVAIYRNLWKM